MASQKDWIDLHNRLEELFELVDNDEKYKETSQILAYTVGQLESLEELDVMGVVLELIEADKTVEMHPEVADLVVTILNRGIEENMPEAMCDLGSLYYNGRLGKVDYEKAFNLYKKASELGNKQATENLAYCYYYGRSVDVDYEKAYKLFAKGALEGNLRCMYKMADFYRYGYYVEMDCEEAYRIYMRCMEEMTEDAVIEVGADIFVRIADCCYEGIGTPVDIQSAFIFYSRAEILCYQRLFSGDYFMKENLLRVQERMNLIREKTNADIFSRFEWLEK
ncbi:MAG: sel1 repeat family protein [Lachnospiraceae bacterium]|nr:sel1 repeat family protein [Lachnospiraceae bacterium]